MNRSEIASPSETKSILNKYNLKAKKNYGQNFLIDLNVLNNIVTTADVSNQDDVIEIGPGIGSLTEQLAKKAHKVVAFEIDTNLIKVLQDTLASYTNVEIINQDVLKVDLMNSLRNKFDFKHPIKVVANLPYYITTPILLKLIKSNLPITNIVVMMQKEVASRLVATPQQKDYGSLSVMMQYLENVRLAATVSRNSFMPAPKVDSAVVSFTPKLHHKVSIFNEESLFSFVKAIFSNRRKTLWKNVQRIFGKSSETKNKLAMVFDELNISKTMRVEELSPDQIIEFANALHNKDFL